MTRSITENTSVRKTVAEVIAEAQAEIESWPPHMRAMLEYRRKCMEHVEREENR